MTTRNILSVDAESVHDCAYFIALFTSCLIRSSPTSLLSQNKAGVPSGRRKRTQFGVVRSTVLHPDYRAAPVVVGREIVKSEN